MKASARPVFLTDDDEDVRHALLLLLRTVGFAVEPFPSALAFLARRNRDAVGAVGVGGAPGGHIDEECANAALAMCKRS